MLMPLIQNAAEAGRFDENYRFSGIYRNQWATVPVNYHSATAAFDFNLLKNFKTNSKLGAGLYFNFDQAGDSKLQNLHLMLPLAYHLSIPIKENRFTISLGAEAGIQYKSLTTKDLYFDSQFNGEVFNPDLSTGENFEGLKVLNFDIGIGTNISFETENKIKVSAGFSLKHLNNATESYLNSNVKPILRKKYGVPFQLYVPILTKWDIEANYLFTIQNQSQEHLSSIRMGYFLANTNTFKQKIQIGFMYRYADATAILLGFETHQYRLGLSYDINVSKFAKATNTYGGIEFAAVYYIKNVEKIPLKQNKKCYTF